MIPICEIIYASLCIIFAWINYKWIEANKTINHNFNGKLHLIAWIICAVFTYKYSWWIWIIPIPKILIVLPFIGKAVFDTSLNLFRKLPIRYIPIPSPNGSKLDKWEYEIFEGNGLLAKFLYSLIILIFNMFYWYST